MTQPHGQHRKHPRRGFGTVIAIVLLLIVAVMLPVIAAEFTANVRRTRSQLEDAQLRQLLTAGAAFAQTQATEAPTTQRSITLPQELIDQGASLKVSFARLGNDRVDATVHAMLGKRAMQQTVTFERRDGHWQAVAAMLNADPGGRGS
jgi:type II secretory pathway component PulK